MRLWFRSSISFCAGLAALAAALGSAQAAPKSDTIDRPMVIYVAGSAGGGIDLYARMLARHMGQHIPGHPSITVEDMPGGGGIKAALDLARLAPRDGTVMGSFTDGPVLEPLTGARDPGYRMNTFTWIGAISKDFSICASWGTSSFKTIQDAERRQMIVASTGAGSESNLWPRVINELIGTKFKIVTGYPGTQEILLAMERGEVQGRCGWTWSSLEASKAEWIRDKKIDLLLQIGLHKSPDLPNVPALNDLLTKNSDRQLLKLFVGPSEMARAFVAPPGLTPERATLLRRAFDATMRDPAFFAEAKTLRAIVSPSTGEDVQKIVADIYATPQPVLDRAKKLLDH